LDTSEETFVSVSKCWKSYSIAGCIVNIKECMDEMKSMPLNGYWKKLWPVVVNDFLEFPNQYDEIRNILLLTHKVPGKGFPHLEVPNVR
jgi:hypothetical protein